MSFLETARQAWQLHRTVTLVDSTPETALGAAAKKWAAILAAYNGGKELSVADGLFKLTKRHNKISIRFRTTATENDTFGGAAYLIKKGDDAKLAFTFTGVVGAMQATMQIGGATTLYADTLLCTETFPNTFSIASAGSDDEMGMISGDAAGWEYLLVLITDTNAGVATEKIAIDVTGW